MLQSTKTAVSAILATDSTIPAEVIKAAIATLNGGNLHPGTNKNGDEVLTLKQVADCLKKSTRTVITYGKRGLIRPVYGAGRAKIGYSRNSVMDFIGSGAPRTANQ